MHHNLQCSHKYRPQKKNCGIKLMRTGGETGENFHDYFTNFMHSWLHKACTLPQVGHQCLANACQLEEVMDYSTPQQP